MSLARRSAGWAVLLALAALAAVAVYTSGASSQGTEGPRGFAVDVQAEVLEDGAPVEVSATDVAPGNDVLEHGVLVTWEGHETAMLDDARFIHHVGADTGSGDLVIAGRGCGADWDGTQAEVMFPCTADLQLIEVDPGDRHEYPVQVHPSLGPLQLAEGTYTVDQVIEWWPPDAEQDREAFTLRLTYDVSERDVEPAFAVDADIVEADAPASVGATSVVEDDEGRPAHGVRVTWEGDAAAVLDDARFTHHVGADDGDGDLVLAGRGCEPSLEDGEVLHICTDDLLLVDLSPGETHEYPVRITPELGDLAATPGTYTVEETIGWYLDGDEATAGEFTVRLTYQVTEGNGDLAPGPGEFAPEPAESGITIGIWGGGAIDDLPDAASYWVTVDGEMEGYIVGAPDFVNAGFMTLYPDGMLPADTPMVLARP